MALDFPSSPSVGQQYNGYVWNGYAWDSTAATPVSITSTAPGYNYVINGAFDVWQRGTTGYVVDSYGSADRWLFSRGTLAQQTFTPGSLSWATSQYYANFSYTGQVFAYMEQRIEDVRALAGQTVTLSFYAKSSTSSPITLRIAQNYGTGGSTATDSFPTTFNLTTSWVRYTYTSTIPSISGKTVGPANTTFTAFGLYGTTSTAVTGNFDIWGVQVETGGTATAFKRNAPSIQAELAACQRYYYRTVGDASSTLSYIALGSATSTSILEAIAPLPVSMRVPPTSIEYSSVAAFRFGSGTTAVSALTSVSSITNKNSVFLNATTSSAHGVPSGVVMAIAVNNGGYVGFSAEL